MPTLEEQLEQSRDRITELLTNNRPKTMRDVSSTFLEAVGKRGKTYGDILNETKASRLAEQKTLFDVLSGHKQLKQRDRQLDISAEGNKLKRLMDAYNMGEKNSRAIVTVAEKLTNNEADLKKLLNAANESAFSINATNAHVILPRIAGRLNLRNVAPLTAEQTSKNQSIDEARQALDALSRNLPEDTDLLQELARRMLKTDEWTGEQNIDWSSGWGATLQLAMRPKVGGDKESMRYRKMVLGLTQGNPALAPPGLETADEPLPVPRPEPQGPPAPPGGPSMGPTGMEGAPEGAEAPGAQAPVPLDLPMLPRMRGDVQGPPAPPPSQRHAQPLPLTDAERGRATSPLPMERTPPSNVHPMPERRPPAPTPSNVRPQPSRATPPATERKLLQTYRQRVDRGETLSEGELRALYRNNPSVFMGLMQYLEGRETGRQTFTGG